MNPLNVPLDGVGNHGNCSHFDLFLDLLSSTAGGNVVGVQGDGTHILLGSAQLEVSSITP